MPFIQDFLKYRPNYILPQRKLLNWLWQKNKEYNPEANEKLFYRIACSDDAIQSRASFLKDFSIDDNSQMRIFGTNKKLSHRSMFYKEAVTDAFRVFLKDRPSTSNAIHVSCTGYVAPSPLQSWVIENERFDTQVSHFYHMGCYAAIPAIRWSMQMPQETEIVHSELCSLHLRPHVWSAEQIVINSLFADGCIAYRMSQQKQGFEVLYANEQLLDCSQEDMQWYCGEDSFHMILSKEVPSLIEENIEKTNQRLTEGLSTKNLFYAIHPGGPKIIEKIQKKLKLSEEQTQHSRDVLRDYGNMSSATLPHIWQKILLDQSIPNDSYIISYAFGPGLSLCSAVFRKLGI